MQIFPTPEAALRAGYRIVDYDLQRQMFVVEKGQQRKLLHARSTMFAALVDNAEA